MRISESEISRLESMATNHRASLLVSAGGVSGALARSNNTRATPKVVRRFCKLVNEGKIGQYTSNAECERRLTGVLPPWILYFLGKAALWAIFQLLRRYIWGNVGNLEES